MKKLLLLAVTAGLALSANAVVNDAATKDGSVAKADAQLMKSTKETAIQAVEVSTMPTSLKSNIPDVKKSDYMSLVAGVNSMVGKPLAAEGEDETEFVAQPYYRIPYGAFYGRTILDGEDASYVRRPLFMPGDIDQTWRQATSWFGDYPEDNFSWTWKYYNLVETADGLGLDEVTENAYGSDGYPVNLTTNYPMYVSGISTPAVEFCGTSYGDGTVAMAGGGEAERYLIQSGGYPSGRVNSGTYPWSFGHFDFYEFNGWAGNGAVCETYTDFVFCNYNNFSLNSARYFKDATILSYATQLNIPEGKQLGVTNVTVNCWVKAIPSSPLKIDFYEMGWAEDPEDPGYGWYVPGKRIGGGWLNPDELTVDSYNQTVVIPMREGEGDFVSDSFVNLTGSVLAIISCDEAADNTINFPIVMMDADKSTWAGFGYFVLDVQRGEEYEDAPLSGKQLYAFTKINATNYQTIANAKLLGLDMNFVGSYTSIDLQADAVVTDIDGVEYLEVVFAADEDEKTVIVEPYWNMESMGKFTVDENVDWLYAYAETWNENYEQPVVIQVDPLPAGVSGREGIIKAEIPGAVLNILVKQGDTSGIDTIEGDNANVVSSQIFDLQGRQLNAVPENGLYIRRDVKADNTVTTTKIVK